MSFLIKKISDYVKKNKVYIQCYHEAIRELQFEPNFDLDDREKILREALYICSQKLLEAKTQVSLSKDYEQYKAANQ